MDKHGAIRALVEIREYYTKIYITKEYVRMDYDVHIYPYLQRMLNIQDWIGKQKEYENLRLERILENPEFMGFSTIGHMEDAKQYAREKGFNFPQQLPPHYNLEVLNNWNVERFQRIHHYLNLKWSDSY